MTEVVFHPSAQTELDQSATFYESRLGGLGKRFVAAVEDATAGIAASPTAGALLGRDFRHRIVPGFPFSLIYRVWSDHIFIVAVAHQHRRPGYWRQRTTER